MFGLFYALGFTPWDGHPLSPSLTALIECGLPPGRALDIGCGTGDNAIYLADHGWQVTGIDYVDAPLREARSKAGGRTATFTKADVTQLSSASLGPAFDLILDSGCLHGTSSTDRDAYVREVTAVAAPDARLLIVAFAPGATFGVPGISSAEVERRFSGGWTPITQGDEPGIDRGATVTARHYLFARA